MSKRSDRKQGPGKNAPPPSTAKGRLVEEIVEKMHGSSNVRVQRRMFLKPVGGGRKREIDVLLTSSIAGTPVSIAIECKNEAKKIGSPKIDAFVGKLKDVGIPSSLGIYVSVNGYTGDAIERARKAGIRTLVLTGLTKDRLSAEVERAFQSMVYLFAEIFQLRAEQLEKQKAVRVVGRYKLPRIRAGAMYWPASEHTTKKLAEIMKAYEAGEIPDPRPPLNSPRSRAWT